MGWLIRCWSMCIVHDSPLLSLLCICSIPREELSSIQRVRRVSYAAYSYLVICSKRHASVRPVWPTLLTHLHPPTTDMNKKKGTSIRSLSLTRGVKLPATAPSSDQPSGLQR